MIIIGIDFHPEFQQIASVDTETGEFQEKRLAHREDAETFYRALAGQKGRAGMEASGHARWFEQLQALALNEGLRCKKRLWREHGRRQLESFRLAPWASRRRRDLLELLDRLNPTIAELSQAIEQEAEKCPEAQRLMTHPGVGPLTALAFVLIIGKAERFQCGKQIASYLGLVPLEKSSGNRRRLGHITKQGSSMVRFLLVEAAQVTVRSLPEWRRKYVQLVMRRGRKIAKVAWRGDWPLLSTGCGARDGITSSQKVRFARGPARNRRWCAVEHRVIEWAARSSSRRSSK